jgi:hypothetical protein
VYIPAFDELAGGDFFGGYFGRAPRYRPDALRQDPRRILSIADLDELLHLEAIRPPYIRVMKDGVMVPHLTFTEANRVQGADVTDTVIPELVYELLRNGATITWPALNHVRPNIRALTTSLAARFATETNATAFLAPAGSRGLNPQHTFFDMFVIQLHGTSGWTLWPRPAACRGDTRHYREGSLGEPALAVTLRPGDVLYVPWGAPHLAVPGAPVSLHLSVMLRVRLWSDLLRLTARRLLADERYLRAVVPNASELTGQQLADTAALLAGQLRQIDPKEEVRRLIGIGRRSPGSAYGDEFQVTAAR